MGRGTFDEKVASHEGVQVIATKWHDNRAVTMLSTFAGAYPTCTIERWDKKTKEMVDVQCPSSVRSYNSNMGGVDLMDSLIALYRTKIRSKKWYLCIYFHLMDMLCVNAWLLYRRDPKAYGQPKREELSLRLFKTSVAEVLCKEGTTSQGKRGNDQVLESFSLNLRGKGIKKEQQCHILRSGEMALPTGGFYAEKQGRCKNEGCTAQTRVMCEKCAVYMCFTPKKNCLRDFNTQDISEKQTQ